MTRDVHYYVGKLHASIYFFTIILFHELRRNTIYIFVRVMILVMYVCVCRSWILNHNDNDPRYVKLSHTQKRLIIKNIGKVKEHFRKIKTRKQIFLIGY